MLSDKLINWMQKKVKARDAKGALVGLSGGVDSATVAGLIKEAFGENCLGVLLPCSGSHSVDEDYAKMTAEEFDLDTIEVNLKEVYEVFTDALSTPEVEEVESKYWPQSKIPSEEVKNQAAHNMKPRLRMVALHYLAEKMNYVVMGTSNKSEVLTGYYTNYGDNATDLRPLGDLTKTEVWQLAREIGVPKEIVERPPTGGLRGEESDEDDIGISYKRFDQIYEALENNKDLSEFSERDVEKVKELIKGAKSKENIPVFQKE